MDRVVRDTMENLHEDDVMLRRSRSFSEENCADDMRFCSTGDNTPTYKRNSNSSDVTTAFPSSFPGSPEDEQSEELASGDDAQMVRPAAQPQPVAQMAPMPNPYLVAPPHVGPQMYMMSVAANGSQIWTPVMPAPMTMWNQMPSPPGPSHPVFAAHQNARSLEATAAALDAQANEAAFAAKRAKAAAVAARKRMSSDQPGRKESSTSAAPISRGGFACGGHPCAGSSDMQTQDSDERTTLMLRNLPNSYNRAALLTMLDTEGFHGQYSFVYLPTDFNNFAGFGYAFVGFETHACAEAAKRHFQGFTKWKVPSQKTCDVAWSGEVQGNKAYIEKYRNSPVMHDSVPDEYKPALFANGLRVPFPAPTKRIRPPRVRHLTSA
jgi:hypothetical protein